MGCRSLDAYSEQGIVIVYGILAAHFAEAVGEFEHRLAVIGFSGEQFQFACRVAYVHVERDVELRGLENVPHAKVDNPVVSYQPS